MQYISALAKHATLPTVAKYVAKTSACYVCPVALPVLGILHAGHSLYNDDKTGCGTSLTLVVFQIGLASSRTPAVKSVLKQTHVQITKEQTKKTLIKQMRTRLSLEKTKTLAEQELFLY